MTKRILVALFLALFCVASAAVAAEKRLTDKEAKAMIEQYKAREADANAKIAELEARVEPLKTEIADLDKQIADLEAQLAECQKQPKYWAKYRVESGDYLGMIAAKPTIYHDQSKWPMIYEANKDIIKNPNLIYPGWVLFIPGLDVYKVFSGDCLWKIASYLTVYGSAKDWPKIYEANKDKIKDADLIYPGQEFTVPR